MLVLVHTSGHRCARRSGPCPRSQAQITHDPQTDCRIFGQLTIHARLDRPHIEPSNASAWACQAAGALAWLERHTALCSANPRECQPTPPIRQGPPLLPVFLPCSRQPRCAQGRAVACLLQSRAFTRRPAASTTLSQA